MGDRKLFSASEYLHYNAITSVFVVGLVPSQEDAMLG
jgi:hypothetical protein